MKRNHKKTAVALTVIFLVFNVFPYEIVKVKASEAEASIAGITQAPANEDNAQVTQAPQQTSNSLKAELTQAAQAYSGKDTGMETSNDANTGVYANQSSESNIVIDGYYDDWEDKPYSWEYNWDNPWKIDNYWNGSSNITKEYKDREGRPYNLDIRHKMSLYCDGDNIYLHIAIASDYKSAFNGEDYQFWIDGQMARFRLTYTGGGTLTKWNKGNEPGNYMVEVRHADSSLSNTVVSGAEAVFTRYDNDLNDEMELKIPLAALKAQNREMNIDSFNTVEFYTPNLMYRRIACSGASTGPYTGIALCIAFAGGAVWVRNRKYRSNKV